MEEGKALMYTSWGSVIQSGSDFMYAFPGPRFMPDFIRSVLKRYQYFPLLLAMLLLGVRTAGGHPGAPSSQACLYSCCSRRAENVNIVTTHVQSLGVGAL